MQASDFSVLNNTKYMESFIGNRSDRTYLRIALISLGCTSELFSLAPLCQLRFSALLLTVVSFQVTNSGYQPSWQMKNNSAGAISPPSDLCLWDNSSLRFLFLHYCVLKGLTQSSGLVPLRFQLRHVEIAKKQQVFHYKSALCFAFRSSSRYLKKFITLNNRAPSLRR